MADRPAPLVLVATPPDGQGFGTHAAVAAEGQRLLGAELSRRLGASGAAVAPLAHGRTEGSFHWGRWFADAARAALAAAPSPVDAIGYAGAGALALVDERGLEDLLSPVAGEVVANNRFSADAFVVAGDIEAAITCLEGCESDNAAPRRLTEGGFAWRDLESGGWPRFDVDTTLDLALLRLAGRLDGHRPFDPALAAFLEMARLPGDRPLEVPQLEALGEVMRSPAAELVVAGRVPGVTWATLETETACRVRGLIEERGMRSGRGGPGPRSVLAALLYRSSPSELVAELARLGDAVVLDSRVLMAAVAESSDTAAWPPREDRFCSDFGDHARVDTAWLRELTEAAERASVPFVLGGHALVSDGLRLIVAAAWQGR